MSFRKLAIAASITTLLWCSTAQRGNAEDGLSVSLKGLFWNVQNALAQVEPGNYIAAGPSPQLLFTVQQGTFERTSDFRVVGTSPEDNGSFPVIEFDARPGPNPVFFGLPVYVIYTPRGIIFCKWEAVFTLTQLTATTGKFSGDRDFTILFGMGRYFGASGNFTTHFETGEFELSADSVTAPLVQKAAPGDVDL